MKSDKDRISELPDEVICEILSNLPTKNAVATTILSKRWKDQWIYCYNLDFSDFLPSNPRFSLDEAQETCFVKFVKDVISLNKSLCIKKFRFYSSTILDCNVDNPIFESHVTTWIDAISRRKVEEIYLDPYSDGEYPVTFPQSLFTCKTLVFLEIVSPGLYDIPSLVHLPSLKVFRVYLEGPSDAETTRLFCGMPVLEDLWVSIKLVSVKTMRLNIVVPKLKRLKLKLEKEDNFDLYNYKIVVRAPSLKKLYISDDILAKYEFEELPLDVKAVLGLGRCAFEIEIGYENVAARAIQVMNQLSAVKSLGLSGYTLGTLDFYNEPHHLAVFPNLTCLVVNVAGCCGWTYLPYLIDRLPSLVVLFLNMVPVHMRSNAFMIREPLRNVPHCLLFHLKRILVSEFQGQEYQLSLLRYLLESAQVLDEVVICTRNMGSEERKNLCQLLLLFPWGSKNCRLKIT